MRLRQCLNCSRLPLELLCGQALTNRDAELLRIDGSPSCLPSDESHMFVITRTQSSQLLRDAGAIGEEADRLQNGSELAADASNRAGHAKLAHVRLYSLYVIMSKDILNLGELPTRGEPKMLVEEEPAVLSLVPVQLGTETDVSLRLLHSELKLLHPDRHCSYARTCSILEAERAWCTEENL